MQSWISCISSNCLWVELVIESPYLVAEKQIAEQVEAAAKVLSYDASDSMKMMNLSREFGDISCSVAFKISKAKNEKPADVAGKIAARISPVGYIGKVTTENGYLNFHLNREIFSALALTGIIKNGEPQVSDMGGKRKVIIEYPSANPMHPIHVGHLRNMVIGDTIARLHDLCGYSVEREDFIQDLGLQMVIAVWGYMDMGSKPDKKFDHWLGEIYAGANSHAEESGFREKLSELARKIEMGNTVESALARDLAERCVRAQYETAFDYGSYHDVMIWESDIIREKILDQAMGMLLEKGLLTRPPDGTYKGCVVMDLSAMGDLPAEFKGLKEKVKVMVRNDGTPGYVAKDIAFHMWKFGMLKDTFRYRVFIEKQANGKPAYTSSSEGDAMDFGHVSEAINIIDVKQDYPQALLRLAFRHIGREDVANGIRHLSYGRVELEQGTLAARKGISIENTADGLLAEARERAHGLIKDRLKLSEEEQEAVANSVALAAIKFAFLRVAPEKWITFSWKWALTFEGDSGPYCQYMNARATRLLEDSSTGNKGIDGADMSKLKSDSEFGLVKEIAKLRDVAERACAEYRPNLVTEYAKDLAFAFSRFYESTPILKDSSREERKARLALVLAFRYAMKVTLGILGIDALDRM